MRFLVVLVLGIVTGGLLGAGILFFNPVSSADDVTPLTVSDRRQVVMNYSAVAAEAIVYTNNGESAAKPVPQKVTQLWEPTVRETEILVTELRDYRGSPVGIGIKFSSPSEDTRLLGGEAIVDSVWHVNIPRKGTLLIAQRENRWNFLREIVIPAHWSSTDSWKGTWRGLLSAGPNALGTAQVYGSSGAYAGLNLESVEYLNASAYSVANGPVAADGQIIIEFPDPEAQVAADADED